MQYPLENSTKVVELKDFPPFISSKTDSEAVSGYLKNVVSLHGQSQCVLLPSLDALGEAIQASITDIRYALRQLKAEGYDNFIPGLYGHISIWHPQGGTV